MSTFLEINEEILNISDKLVAERDNPDKEPEEALLAELAYFFELQENKVDNIAKFELGMKARIKALKEEEDRLKKIRQVEERRLNTFMEYLQMNMQRLEATQVKGKLYSISRVMNPPKVEINEDSFYADSNKSYFEIVQTYKADKKAVKEALTQGQEVIGATLTQSERIKIK